MSRLHRTQSSSTVAQPSALLPRSQSVADIRDRAGFEFLPSRPLTHYSNFPYRYYNGYSVGTEPSYPHRYLREYSYGSSSQFKPSQLRSYYRHEPNYYDYPWHYNRWVYRNHKFDYDPYRKSDTPLYGTLFNYFSPYRGSFHKYYLTTYY